MIYDIHNDYLGIYIANALMKLGKRVGYFDDYQVRVNDKEIDAGKNIEELNLTSENEIFVSRKAGTGG